MAGKIFRGQFNLQFRHGSESENIASVVQVSSTADFLVHLIAINNGPNPSWLGLVHVSSLFTPAHVNHLDMGFRVPDNSGSQYLGCFGANATETIVMNGIVTLLDGEAPLPYQSMLLTVTVVSEGTITVTPLFS